MTRLIRFCFFCFAFLLAAAVSRAQPVANFSASPVTGCYPHVVSFTDLSVNATSWNWDFGNGSTSTLRNPVATYLSPGVYTVTLVATGPTGSDTESKSSFITVYGPPTFTFAGLPTSGCLPLTVAFSANVTPNSPGIATYLWDFGDGTPNSTDEAPSHTYTTAGTFTVNLTVTNGAGCDTPIGITGYITVYGPPAANFSVNQQIFCTATPVTAAFNNISTSPSAITSTTWDFGDGGTGSGMSPNHSYNAGGVFNVTMITTNVHGCSDTETKANYVGVYPTPLSFSGPRSVCVNQEVTYVNTTPGLSQVKWDFGSFDTPRNAAVQHIFNFVGSFGVTISAMIGPCAKTFTDTIRVHPRPITTITFSPDIPCPPPVLVSYKATSNTAFAQYLWGIDGASFTARDTVSHIYTTPGYKSVWIVTTDSVTGCSDSAFLNEVPINTLTAHIVADPVNGSTCIPFSPSFVVSIYGSLPPPINSGPPQYPAGISSYNWAFNSGIPATSTADHPTVTWNAVGTYWLYVNGMTDNGCPYQDSIYIHADTPVVPDFVANPLAACVHSPITFTNLTPPNTGMEFEWLTGEDPSSSFNLTYRYRHPGLKTITLAAKHNGCFSSAVKHDYIDIHGPDANFNFLTPYCPPNFTVQFTDLSDGANAWLWDFGDGGPTDTVQNPTHVYAAAGDYQVTLTTYNTIYGCHDSARNTVRLRSPNLEVTATDTAICLGEPIDFDGRYVNATNAAGAWIFDHDTVTDYYTNPAIRKSFTDTGFHDVRFITKSGPNYSCYDTLYLPRYILVSSPAVGFSANPPIGCQPALITFIDSTKPVSTTNVAYRLWNYGNHLRVPVSGTTTTHYYPAIGRDTVTLHVTDNLGCQDSLTKIIEIRRPHAAFGAADTTVCLGASLQFRDSSTGVTALTYLWDFGDGKTDTARSPIHRWDSTGRYTVSLKVWDATPCGDTSIRIGFIRVLAPKASFTASKKVSACQPLVVQFTNSSVGAATYSWDLGTGSSPSPVTNPVNTYRAPGIYTVTLIATDAYGCADTVSDSIYVLGYGGAFNYTPLNACALQEIQFTAIAGVPQIQWDFDDGNVATTSVPYTTHMYANPGVYFPKVIFTESPGCSSGSAGLLPIRIDKVSADFSTSIPCAGAPFTLTQKAVGTYDTPNRWIWRFSAADSLLGGVVSYMFNTPGLHPVKLIASSALGCKDTIIKDVFVNSLPIVDAGPVDTGICPGDLARLIGHGAVSYNWSPTNLVSCVACDTTYVGQAVPPTWYYVAGTDTNGCVNRDSILAHIQIKTTSSVQPGGDICIGESFRLHVSGADVYNWQPERFLDSPNIASPLATPIITTHYVVAAQEGTCLIRYDTVTVVVHPAPYFDAGPDEIINYGASVMLHPTRGGIKSIEWSTDTTLSCLDCFDPVAKPTYTTRYYATATSEFGCKATDSLLVKVLCNGDSVFIPNTFTPNGDGLNDYFFPRGKGVDHLSSFRIFNRWGELVFERGTMPINDEKSGWDGTFKGAQLAPDVYMYTMTSRCENGDPVSWKGDITLIR